MKRFTLYLSLFLGLLISARVSFAQDSTTISTPFRVAIFAPLYLDSAFDNMDNYRFAKNNWPEFINPGLEFYEGVQLALDSLEQENIPLEVFILDSKSSTQSIPQLLGKP